MWVNVQRVLAFSKSIWVWGIPLTLSAPQVGLPEPLSQLFSIVFLHQLRSSPKMLNSENFIGRTVLIWKSLNWSEGDRFGQQFHLRSSASLAHSLTSLQKEKLTVVSSLAVAIYICCQGNYIHFDTQSQCLIKNGNRKKSSETNSPISSCIIISADPLHWQVSLLMQLHTQVMGTESMGFSNSPL